MANAQKLFKTGYFWMFPYISILSVLVYVLCAITGQNIIIPVLEVSLALPISMTALVTYYIHLNDKRFAHNYSDMVKLWMQTKFYTAFSIIYIGVVGFSFMFFILSVSFNPNSSISQLVLSVSPINIFSLVKTIENSKNVFLGYAIITILWAFGSKIATQFERKIWKFVDRHTKDSFCKAYKPVGVIEVYNKWRNSD